MIGLDTSVLVQLEVSDTPRHAEAHDLFHREVLATGDSVALAPQVVLEFLHIVTDGRRFPRPLSMADAITRARFWLSAREVRIVTPGKDANDRFLEWMLKHQLGRKRIIDTHLAASLHTAGVRRLMTSNPGDFSVFGVFELLSP